MQLQQYINIHPVLKIEKKSRIAYVSLIYHLCKKSKEDILWSNSMLALMKTRFTDGEDLFSVETNSHNNLLFKEKNSCVLKHKFFKYRYSILTDCLFINAFGDKKKGKIILNRICKIFPNNKKKLLRLYNLFYKVELKIIKKEFSLMEDIFRIIKNNREFLLEPEKRIIITANMSAGKSTLLNALAGKKVNKTQNDTCTAKIHYLYNKAGEDNLSYELDYDLELDASFDILMEDNIENDSLEVVVGTRFRSLRSIEKRVCFIDTPGVNSSQNIEHREMTDDALSYEKYDLLIYLLNGENIGTNDDIKHLKYVYDSYQGDVLFLVNKLDHYKKDTDSVQDTLHKVKEDLIKIGFASPRVYPISAYAAYLAKMSIYDMKLSDDEIDDREFRKRKLSKEKFRYDKYYDIPPYTVDEKNEDEVLLRNSGILSLEKILYEG